MTSRAQSLTYGTILKEGLSSSTCSRPERTKLSW